MVRDQAERDALGDNWHRSPDEAVAARARGGKPAVAPVDEGAICRELFETLPERLIDWLGGGTEDLAGLKRLRAREQLNPKREGGRPEVLVAIERRIGQILGRTRR
jgi:hypothetical protein